MATVCTLSTPWLSRFFFVLIVSSISGEIIALNETLEDTPEMVNEDPYGAGWMVKVQCNDLSQLDNLLDAEAYTSLVTG